MLIVDGSYTIRRIADHLMSPKQVIKLSDQQIHSKQNFISVLLESNGP